MIDHYPHDQHGGSDAQGAPEFDFSTNANSCGPCPSALTAVLAADRSRYPDPAYVQLRDDLADFHGVNADQIVIGASGSELIQRVSLWAARSGLKQVRVPQHGFGDYARAARQAGLTISTSFELSPCLIWHAQPSSPLGRWEPVSDVGEHDVVVIDAVYAPLLLERQRPEIMPQAWTLHSPNKALALTGVRAAYLVLPLEARQQAEQLAQMASSWCVGAEGVAMLQAWTQPATQQWLAQCLPQLRRYKNHLIAHCQDWGWECLPSDTHFFCAKPPDALTPEQIKGLRDRGIKLRDATSFGLAGWVRMSAQPPRSVAALNIAVKPLNTAKAVKALGLESR